MTDKPAADATASPKAPFSGVDLGERTADAMLKAAARAVENLKKRNAKP